jgi:hypothetical protein
MLTMLVTVAMLNFFESGPVWDTSEPSIAIVGTGRAELVYLYLSLQLTAVTQIFPFLLSCLVIQRYLLCLFLP